MCNTQESLGLSTLFIFQNSKYLENITFRKLGQFASSGQGRAGDTYSVGSLRKS
jgi:hypothetical protein